MLRSILRRFRNVRSSRDLCSVADFVVYAIKYAPASLAVGYVLELFSRDHLRGWPETWLASLIVAACVDVRASMRRRRQPQR